MEQFTTRQNKVSRLIQREIADIILQINKTKHNGKLISVSVVRVTKDMGIARIYLSIYPSSFSKEILDGIQLSKNLSVVNWGGGLAKVSGLSRSSNFTLMTVWIILKILTICYINRV